MDELVIDSGVPTLSTIANSAVQKLNDTIRNASSLDLMATLAGADSGAGHVEVVKAISCWLESCRKYLSHKDVAEKLEANVPVGRHQVVMESTCYMLSYLADIFEALKLLSNESTMGRTASPIDSDSCLLPGDMDSDWLEELTGPDDDESQGEESDEDSLCNKLCTFTFTQKDFMNQHWYHCHTCKMVEGVGVCTVCAKVCHRDHDVTYAKYGSFFCDCGAKEDSSCKALTKRSSNDQESYRNAAPALNDLPVLSSAAVAAAAAGLAEANASLPSSLRRRQTSPERGPADSHSDQSRILGNLEVRHLQLSRQLASHKTAIINVLASRNIASTVLQLLQYLSPSIAASCRTSSSIGASLRAKGAMRALHTEPKRIEESESLLLPTLGSQEGAFENVKLSYTGEQGAQMRQLINSNVIRRVAMCALTTVHGKRQHLAVSHEKGKITLLQLSALLKQADSSKKKLTLTRLASAPVPFTALSITANSCNEDFLAVVGLKDCHVLTFSPNGTVIGHLVIQLHLDTGNHVVKAVWLPGSQVELAVITADFVKIFDLSVDAAKPQYFLLPPSGKVRDLTFVFGDDGKSRHALLMTSTGHIYAQELNEDSSARHGQFYVTSLLELRDDEITETSNGQICGGGVSLYYSHTFQLLFVSYANGKSFAAPLTEIVYELSNLFNIEVRSSTQNSSSSSSSSPTSSANQTNNESTRSGSPTITNNQKLQPLCQWTEVLGHPGLILAMSQSTNNPIAFMIKPDAVVVQEVRFVNQKSKITDMVALRHLTSSGDTRTTLILLCEDGSLRIYMASQEATNFWLRPQLNPSNSGFLNICSSRSRKKNLNYRASGKINKRSSSLSQSINNFPVDFFEQCSLLTDLEYGGNDVLQVYNVAQVKQRLNTNSQYIASTKPHFTIEITNNDSSSVMVGARVLLGTQDANKTPMYIELFGRQVPTVGITRARWFDLPFTREESLASDKKLMLTFGASNDPNGIIMVDSIKIYGKTKEAFMWPDDADYTAPYCSTGTDRSDQEPNNLNSQCFGQLSSLDRFLSCALEVLEGALTVPNVASWLNQSQKEAALDIVTSLVTLPFPNAILQNIKAVMMALHSSRAAFNNHRDAAILNHVIRALTESNNEDELDGEAFYRLITITRSIAAARPSNLIKFSECLTAAIKEPCADIELQTISSSVDITASKSCQELTANKDATAPQRSVSFETSPPKISSSAGTGAAFMMYLSDVFWKLYALRPEKPQLSPIPNCGLVHPEATVQAIVEIINAFTLFDPSNVSLSAKLYIKLLLCNDTTVSFAAKQSIIRVLRPKVRKTRKVQIPTPQGMASQVSGARKPTITSLSSINSSLGPEARSIEAQEDVFVENLENNIRAQADQAYVVAAAIPPQAEMVAVGENFEEMLAVAADVAEAHGQYAAVHGINMDLVGDEAMVELAIALSLQEQNGDDQGQVAILAAAGPNNEIMEAGRHSQNQAGAGGASRSVSREERPAGALSGHYSDTTASPAASDDEGSTNATDGSTLRTSPVPAAGADNGSESGGNSPVESMIGDAVMNASGRSSAYGEEALLAAASGTSTSAQAAKSTDRLKAADSTTLTTDLDDLIEASNAKLHAIRVALLERLIEALPEVRQVGGVNCIPFMQVMLMLSSDVDMVAEGERDRRVMQLLLNSLLGELQFDGSERMTERTPNHEVKLIIMRLLSILMSRVKDASSSSSKENLVTSTSGHYSMLTAQTLISSNILDLCLDMLVTLLSYWKNLTVDEEAVAMSRNAIHSGTLHPHSSTSPPDMSPFFLRQYVKGHADDVFELYPQLLTEMVLRLPYQIKKISNSLAAQAASQGRQQHMPPSVTFSPAWIEHLCEYMMAPLTSYVKKQVRKLLSYICISKERYRQVRDMHALESHLSKVIEICHAGGYVEYSAQTPNSLISLNYDQTISLIERLKACSEIAGSRMNNWQRYCHSIAKHPKILPFLINISYLLDEGVASLVLTLLLAALSPAKSSKSSSSSNATGLDRQDSSESGSSNIILSHQIMSTLERPVLERFIKCFLLESNSSALRWQAHSLIYNLYRNFEARPTEQQSLLECLWSLWPQVASYGRKAIQFVDLLGFFTLKNENLPEEKQKEYAEAALKVLRSQNVALYKHPNSNIYNSLQSLVEFDGYYLESEPCLVCNNPEVNFTSVKLSSLKVDSRFTTSTQIVKLVGSHAISKISLRISDIKRSKLVKTLNIYYNNRAVHSVVELKNKSGIWHRAKRCTLAAGQTEVKIDFPLPFVACNLMIEYADFYENMQASSETLQCPRCSASVPATPGVCSNCGENVFQCHKCRAINYDEKDPFLCNSCGFCKYAKFDFGLTAKATCAIDPIENEEDRKKTVQSINTLLEKADRVYKNLTASKPALELFLLKIQEHGFIDKLAEESLPLGVITVPQPSAAPISTGASSTSHVNRAIQQIAQKYCSECKAAFDELSKILQKVLASRKELVEYDNKQRERSLLAASPNSARTQPSISRRDSRVISPLSSGRCYGCSSATLEHCITLLKALSMAPHFRNLFCASGLLRELLDYNLRTGTAMVRAEVRQLLCTLTRDNFAATTELNNMIMDQITLTLKSRLGTRIGDFSASVRHEIALLLCSLEKEDACWELRLRCVMQIFLKGIADESPTMLEAITLPCLRLLINLIKPEPPGSQKNKEKSIDQIATVSSSGLNLSVDLHKWMAGDSNHAYSTWRQRTTKKFLPVEPIQQGGRRSAPPKKTKAEVRAFYLSEKYGTRWREKCLKSTEQIIPLDLLKDNWLKSILFNRYSRTIRLMACTLIEALFQVPSRSKHIVEMLTSCLDHLGSSGEFGAEFFALYHSIIQQDFWKYYLAIKGVLLNLGTLITAEIDKLNELEETTLNSDLSEGCALKMLVDLLTVFVDVPTIRQQYKSRLVAFILNGYLSLRKLVVQRTKIIDETQDTLLELLEEMTTGTEAETEAFMEVCLEAVNKCKLDDLRTPVFIFERLCSIIYPEEPDTSEFFITLEKDPQQEDFLQGRMLGNPYPSNEPGLGPLMRDIKNKICQDCELVALLDDDSGMELLVCNKIVSLDLPVKQVFRKVWCTENPETESMRVIYRMRGLMGDATEEFIESLDSKDSQEVDNENVYKMANNMSRWGGLEVMLQRMSLVTDLSPRCRPLLLVLLKLFGHCVKVKSNRERLIEPDLKAIQVLLNILELALRAEPSELAPAVGGLASSAGQPNVLEQLLAIMETILCEASTREYEQFESFSRTCGSETSVKILLKEAMTSDNAKAPNVRGQLMRVITFLTLGQLNKERALLDFFAPHLNFKKFDFEHSPDDETALDAFCQLSVSIEMNANGNALKDLILKESQIVNDALEYLTIHAPTARSALLAASEEWKEFTQRPALKYVLRILTGLSSGHEPTQLSLVSAETIPVIHGLEQVSSDSHAGSLAEALLETLKQNRRVAEKIEMVRRQTKDEKKRLAMAVREKQLAELGLKTNASGQVTAAHRDRFKQVEDLGEESGLVCSICREGYAFQPAKVLGVYTFTKRCVVELYEGLGPQAASASKGTRKTMGYSTVTHFNVVHVDCHMSAVRHARGRDEWESAALQNASTRCNGLLPLWGPGVQESAFASCLARHNTYVQEATGHRDINSSSGVHDLKLLLTKFAAEESFSVDSGGGGPQSNVHLIPYLAHITLYVINTTRASTRECKKIAAYLEQQPSKWIESAFEPESAFYWATMYLLMNAPTVWQRDRKNFLRRFIIQAHARACVTQPAAASGVGIAGAEASAAVGGGPHTFFDKVPRDYGTYKTSFVFFGLIDACYNVLFKNVPKEDESLSLDWPLALAEYIRNSDQQLIDQGVQMLDFYQNELLPSESLDELCDVLKMLDEIEQPELFIAETLESCDL